VVSSTDDPAPKCIVVQGGADNPGARGARGAMALKQVGKTAQAARDRIRRLGKGRVAVAADKGDAAGRQFRQ